jgi:uncharacterized membrane protein YtjA (UPF0391 family)
MLKRAYISAVVAAIAAIFGYSGLLDGAAPIARGICYAFGGFCGLSLLFSLFEDVTEPIAELQANTLPEEPAPQLVFNFATEQSALAPVHA